MSANGQFPDTLVLPFTTLYSSGGCSKGFVAQITQGNTFSAAFDMTKAPHAPGQNGVVYLKTDPQSNFVAAKRVELANEGLSDKIAFMSVSGTPAKIFGEQLTVTRIYLVGTPKGDVFTWQTGILLGNNCIVTNGKLDDAVVAALKK